MSCVDFLPKGAGRFAIHNSSCLKALVTCVSRIAGGVAGGG